jgi:hypothetical protein
MSNQRYSRHYGKQGNKNLRNRMLGKIHTEFPKLRPDLRHSTAELKMERLAFCERVLSLRKPLDSMRRLSNEQLGKVIEAIKREMPHQTLPGCSVHHFKSKAVPASPGATTATDESQQATIHHLAGNEQVWAIRRVLAHLGWSKAFVEQFIRQRYKRTGPEMLTPNQANALLMMLFNCAASRDLKERHGQQAVINKQMKGRYIPELKRKLGIAQAGKSGVAAGQQSVTVEQPQ